MQGAQTMNVRGLMTALAVAALLLGGSPAAAQVGTFRPERPNRALFGGGYGEAEQSVIFTGQVGGGRSTVGEITAADGFEPSPRTSSDFAHLSGNLTYLFDRDRLGFDATASSSAHYFPGEDGELATGNSGRLGARLSLTSRTELLAGLGIALEPLSAISLLPGLDDGGGLDSSGLDYGLGFGTEEFLRYQASVGLSQALTSRLGLEVSYYRSFAEYADQGANEGGGFLAGVRYRIGRGLTAHAGYGVDEATPAARFDGQVDDKYRGRRFDAGVEFNRALSISRRTTLSFDTGSVVLSEAGRSHYLVVGSAGIRREIGRTWFSTVSYNRDVTFVSVFARPSSTESVTSSLSGLLGRHVNLAAQGGVSRGKIGFSDDTNGYTMYRAGTGLSVGLTRSLGLGIFYSYFRYRFDRAGALPDVLPQTEMSGHALRVGLDLFAQIFHRAGRP